PELADRELRGPATDRLGIHPGEPAFGLAVIADLAVLARRRDRRRADAEVRLAVRAPDIGRRRHDRGHRPVAVGRLAEASDPRIHVPGRALYRERDVRALGHGAAVDAVLVQLQVRALDLLRGDRDVRVRLGHRGDIARGSPALLDPCRREVARVREPDAAAEQHADADTALAAG